MSDLMRGILRSILRGLSRITLQKHQTRVIAIFGWHGTWVVKEGIYLSLKDEIIVRRNTNPVNWDFSIPLTILGYEEFETELMKAKSPLTKFIMWCKIILSTLYLTFSEKPNPHTIILELDADKHDIYEYWLSIIKPEVLVIVNVRSGMENALSRLVNATSSEGLIVLKEGISIDDTLAKKVLILNSWSGKGIIGILPEFVSHFFGFVIPVASHFLVSEEIVLRKLRHFEIPPQKITAILKQLRANE